MNHILRMPPKIIFRISSGKIGNQVSQAEVEGMSFSNNEVFYEAWRFEECPELLKEIELGSIVFFSEKQSSILWSMYVSQNEKHMMKVDFKIFSNVEHYDVDFENKKSADKFFCRFQELAKNPLNVLVFFGEKYLCVTPFYLFKEYWNHFFLPSDENTVVVTEKNNHFIFSYEERLFIVTR